MNGIVRPLALTPQATKGNRTSARIASAPIRATTFNKNEETMSEALAQLAAVAATKKPVREPETIRRLRTIKPGQEVVYYRGDAQHVRSLTPVAYHDLVNRIMDFARGLALSDRATLTTRKRIAHVNMRDGSRLPVEVTDYIAVGKARDRECV